MVCIKCTIGSEIALGTLDSVNLDTRWVHGLRRTYHRFRNHFGRNRWYYFVMWVKWKLTLVHLEIVLISTQDRCTVFCQIYRMLRSHFGCI
jgi:hypothetical protein